MYNAKQTPNKPWKTTKIRKNGREGTRKKMVKNWVKKKNIYRITNGLSVPGNLAVVVGGRVVVLVVMMATVLVGVIVLMLVVVKLMVVVSVGAVVVKDSQQGRCLAMQGERIHPFDSPLPTSALDVCPPSLECQTPNSSTVDWVKKAYIPQKTS